MQKRKIIIGTYDTDVNGKWTLSAWELSRAVAFESYADIPGHGQIDLSTVLTDGEPYYENREFTATLESSEGTRLEREQRINDMINTIDGWRLNIKLPDDTTRYITGRIRVEKLYNDQAHCAVQVKAICEPWRYSVTETVVQRTATTTEQTVVLTNNGRRALVPRITVTKGDVKIKYPANGGTLTNSFSPGTYNIVDFYLKKGTMSVVYSGTGTIAFTYREAVL